MDTSSFEAFEAQARAAGAREVLARSWAPGQVVATHTHAFVADAVVVAGEMWLECDGEARHLLAGDTFHLPANTPHSERYGPEGATYWVARRS